MAAEVAWPLPQIVEKKPFPIITKEQPTVKKHIKSINSLSTENPVPPNTSSILVTAKVKRYIMFFYSFEQKNTKVIIKRE